MAHPVLMTDGEMHGSEALPAADFSVWLVGMQAAIRGEGDSDVPCGTCAACCTSSQFIHIGPDETEALASIPSALLFPAPGMPDGHVLMGYDARGHCPMLVDGACSIYAARPSTCRTYDCRVFAAARTHDTDPSKAEITARVQRWHFSYASPVGTAQHEAVAAAAAFLAAHEALLPPGIAPANATQLAVLAVVLHDCFLAGEADGPWRIIDPDPGVVLAAALRRSA